MALTPEQHDNLNLRAQAYSFALAQKMWRPDDCLIELTKDAATILKEAEDIAQWLEHGVKK